MTFNVKRRGRIWKPFFLNITFVLLLFNLGIFAGVFIRNKQLIESEILTRARSHVHNILLARSWNAGYGGVYVEKGEGVETSPFLENAEIETVDGTILTRRNPALMAREISDLSHKGGLYTARITSLKPINPENAPNPFEKEALGRFERGDKEVKAQVRENGRTIFQYMAPLLVEESCLSCHGKQGYTPGDIRGGISVRFDITGIRNEITKNTWVISLLGVTISLLLLAVIYRIILGLKRKIAEYQSKIQKMAITDELTGLFNRRHFFFRLQEEFERTKRYGAPLGCLMLDIDHFKNVNDTWGHHNGDRVLEGISSVLKEACRGSDVVARLGGEEFVVLLPETKAAGALAVAEKIRKSVAESCFPADSGETITVTVSLGVAAPEPETLAGFVAADHMVKLADEALYAAKAGGRNRVEAAMPEPHGEKS